MTSMTLMRGALMLVAIATAGACTPRGIEIPLEARAGAVPLTADRIAAIDPRAADRPPALLLSDADGHLVERMPIEVDTLTAIGAGGPGWPLIFAGRASRDRTEVALIALDAETGERRWWGRLPTLGAARAEAPGSSGQLRVDLVEFDVDLEHCLTRSALVDPWTGEPVRSPTIAEFAAAHTVTLAGPGCSAATQPPACVVGEVTLDPQSAVLSLEDPLIRGHRCADDGHGLRYYAWTEHQQALFAGDRGGALLASAVGDARVRGAPKRTPTWLVAIAGDALEATRVTGDRPRWRARAGADGPVPKDIFSNLREIVIEDDLAYAVGDDVVVAVDTDDGALLAAIHLPGARGVLGLAGGALWIHADGPRPWILVDPRTLEVRGEATATAIEVVMTEESAAPISWSPPPPTIPSLPRRVDPTPPIDWEAAVTPSVRRRLGLPRAGEPTSIDIVAWEYDEWAFHEPAGVSKIALVAGLGEPIRETVFALLIQNAGPWSVERELHVAGEVTDATIRGFGRWALPEPASDAWPTRIVRAPR